MGTLTERPALSTIRRRVGRGIRLLDQRSPGWRSKVDVDSLDLASFSQCVLGQIYGSYTEGVGVIYTEGWAWSNAADEFAKDHGFEGGRIYDALTEEWKRRLSK